MPLQQYQTLASASRPFERVKSFSYANWLAAKCDERSGLTTPTAWDERHQDLIDAAPSDWLSEIAEGDAKSSLHEQTADTGPAPSPNVAVVYDCDELTTEHALDPKVSQAVESLSEFSKSLRSGKFTPRSHDAETQQLIGAAAERLRRARLAATPDPAEARAWAERIARELSRLND